MRMYLFSLIFGVLSMGSYKANEYRPPIYIELLAKIEKQVEREVLKKYNLNCVGVGGNLMYDVNYVRMEFENRGKLTKEQLRRMLLDINQIYLDKINNNEEIKVYLRKVPFEKKNINITIYSQNSSGRENRFPNISVALLLDGDLIYRYSHETHDSGYKLKEIESYQEALEKLSKETEC